MTGWTEEGRTARAGLAVQGVPLQVGGGGLLVTTPADQQVGCTDAVGAGYDGRSSRASPAANDNFRLVASCDAAAAHGRVGWRRRRTQATGFLPGRRDYWGASAVRRADIARCHPGSTGPPRAGLVHQIRRTIAGGRGRCR